MFEAEAHELPRSQVAPRSPFRPELVQTKGFYFGGLLSSKGGIMLDIRWMRENRTALAEAMRKLNDAGTPWAGAGPG